MQYLHYPSERLEDGGSINPAMQVGASRFGYPSSAMRNCRQQSHTLKQNDELALTPVHFRQV